MNDVMNAIGFIVPCAAVILLLLVAAYWACSAINYSFRRRENKADYDHECEMLEAADAYEYYRQRRLQENGYELEKQLIQAATDRVKWLSRDVVKQINDGRVEAAKSIMGDVVNMTKDMMKEMQEML